MLYSNRQQESHDEAKLQEFLSLLQKHIFENRRIRVERSREVIGDEIPLIVDELSIYHVRKIITWRDEVVNLCRMQFNLVDLLIASRGRFVSKEAMIEDLLAKHTSADPRTILDDVINGTRRKFKLVDPNFDRLTYSKRIGCSWAVEEAAPCAKFIPEDTHFSL